MRYTRCCDRERWANNRHEKSPAPKCGAQLPLWHSTDACFMARDADGQALAYVYSRTSRHGARRGAPRPVPEPTPPAAPFAINVIGLSSGWHIRWRRRA